ncbi:MAG: hypothetical protein HQK55_03125 [Deltaproteobacteria bacterium]|nr:hypothetical protein [Deltaproteobacteria bacterium]
MVITLYAKSDVMRNLPLIEITNVGSGLFCADDGLSQGSARFDLVSVQSTAEIKPFYRCL